MWMREKGGKKRKGEVWIAVWNGDAYLKERQIVVGAEGRENTLGSDTLFNDQGRGYMWNVRLEVVFGVGLAWSW